MAMLLSISLDMLPLNALSLGPAWDAGQQDFGKKLQETGSQVCPSKLNPHPGGQAILLDRVVSDAIFEDILCFALKYAVKVVRIVILVRIAVIGHWEMRW